MSNNIRNTKYALIETEIDVMGGIGSKIVGVYDSECESIYEMGKCLKSKLMDWGNDAILDLRRNAIWIDEENKGNVGIVYSISKFAA